MSQFTTAQDNQNHLRSAPSNNNNNHNDNLHQQQSPPIIQLESDDEDDDDEDVEFLEIVQKSVPPAVCLVKTGGKLDYHNDCLCVKCRMIKQFLAKLNCGETDDCDCKECRQNADASVGDQQQEQQPQVPNEVTNSQVASLEPTNNEQPQPEASSHENDVDDDDDRYSKCSTPDYMPQIFSGDDDDEDDDDDEEEEVQLPTPVNGQFKCSHCSKRFPTKPRYVEHVITHSDKKPFGCSRCAFKAKRESYVAAHYRKVHFGRRLYRCSLCGFANSVFNDICGHIQNKHRTELGHHGCNWKNAIGKYVLKRYLAPKRT